MKNTSSFFKKLYSTPSLLWKAGAGVMFLGFALAILFVPSLTRNLDTGMRFAFAGIIGFYAIYRLFTFYVEYKNYDND